MFYAVFGIPLCFVANQSIREHLSDNDIFCQKIKLTFRFKKMETSKIVTISQFVSTSSKKIEVSVYLLLISLLLPDHYHDRHRVVAWS
jgi:hypothetical protein